MSPDFSPKGIGEVIDDAIAAYRAAFRTLALPAACILLPTGLFVGLAQAVYFRTVSVAAPDAAVDLGRYVAAISGSYATLAGMVSLRGLFSLYYFACVLAATPEIIARRPLGLREFLKRGAGAFLSIFVISIVTWIPGTVLVLVGLIPFILPAFVIGMAVYGYASMAESVAGVEGVSFDRALGRAWGLVIGNFWRTVGFVAAIGFLVYALDSAITSVAAVQVVVQAVSGGTSGDPTPVLGWQVLAGVLQGAAQTLTLPLMYVAMLHFYLDLRARREGMDLLARAQALVAAA